MLLVLQLVLLVVLWAGGLPLAQLMVRRHPGEAFLHWLRGPQLALLLLTLVLLHSQ